MKYLDPENDLTFKKIFGEHPNIMKSFLNSILPLDEDQYIVELTYSDPALIPVLPELKHSIVDVRCTDNFDRIFIVEMQMYWTSSFASRMLFNSSKAYIKQIDKGFEYSKLHPVYGLSLVDDIFLKEEKDKENYYHHYRLAHQELPDEYIKGIELIFIELPKFKASTFSEKKIRNLWLRFLTEINEKTTEVSEELYSETAIREALEYLQESAFTKEDLAYYDKYWDNIRVEKTALNDYYEKGLKVSHDKLQQAKEKVVQAEEKVVQAEEKADLAEEKADLAEEKADLAEEKVQEERRQKEDVLTKLLKSAKEMKHFGMPTESIIEATGLSVKEITEL